MARKRTNRGSHIPVESVRHKDKRTNIPTSELRDFVAEDEQKPKTILYPRDPSLDPQLVWKGKDEQDSKPLEVPAVPIYIQEKIHPQALIENLRQTAKAGEKEPELTLFDDFNGLDEFEKKVEFYQHEQNWANRMILGDSLLVMTSLAEKEGLKGKVQMIYLDPPYGIKFGSNWQVSTRKRDVKDGKVEDATREPEQIRAFRDTWKLGIHSYLAYWRDRLRVARELLTETGSIFVQIGDENVHLVRCVMDEVFGSGNFIAQIAFVTTTTRTATFLNSVFDTLLWYGKDITLTKYRQLLAPLGREHIDSYYEYVQVGPGYTERLTRRQISGVDPAPTGNRFRLQALNAQHPSDTRSFPFHFRGKTFTPPAGRQWSTSESGLLRLVMADRAYDFGRQLRVKRYLDDFGYAEISNTWGDTQFGGFGDERRYVVQTPQKLTERCVLMTTDPGDLVLDPTCVREGTRVLTPAFGAPSPSLERGKGGEGISSRPIESLHPGDLVLTHTGRFRRVLAVQRREHRGRILGIRRRGCSETLWITPEHPVATPLPPLPQYQAKVATARALRQTATPSEEILWHALRNGRFRQKFRRQHVLGPFVVDFYCPQLRLAIEVDGAVHDTLDQQAYDRFRQDMIAHYGVGFLRIRSEQVAREPEQALSRIAAAVAEREESFARGIRWAPAGELRVGDTVFCRGQEQTATIESIVSMETIEPVYNLSVEDDNSYVTEVCTVHNCGSGTTAFVAEQWGRRWITIDTSRVALTLARTRLMSGRYPYYLLADSPEGIMMEAEITGRVPPSPLPPTEADIRKGFVYKRVPHITLRSIANNEEIDGIHARWQEKLEPTRARLNEARGRTAPGSAGVPPASRKAKKAAETAALPGRRANSILAMGDKFLKRTGAANLFMVFGEPDIEIRRDGDGKVVVEIKGVDVYDPTTGQIRSHSTDDIACWLVDTNYDGESFFVRHAYFCGNDEPYEKLGRALKAEIDEAAWASLYSTVSRPFAPPATGKIAVKVINHYGDEVLKVYEVAPACR